MDRKFIMLDAINKTDQINLVIHALSSAQCDSCFLQTHPRHLTFRKLKAFIVQNLASAVQASSYRQLCSHAACGGRSLPASTSGPRYTAHWEVLGCALRLLTTTAIPRTGPVWARGFCPGSRRPRARVPLVVWAWDLFVMRLLCCGLPPPTRHQFFALRSATVCHETYLSPARSPSSPS